MRGRENGIEKIRVRRERKVVGVKGKREKG